MKAFYKFPTYLFIQYFDNIDHDNIVSSYTLNYVRTKASIGGMLCSVLDFRKTFVFLIR